MKKTITIILIITMLSGLFSACSQQNNAHSSPTVTEENIPTTESVAETNASTEPTTHDLTLYDVIDWLNAYADQNNLNHVTDLETKQAEEPGVINYSFSFLDGQIHINVQETNGIANSILAYAFPFSLPNVSNQVEAVQICTGLVTLPVLPCYSKFNPQSGITWHADQIDATVQKNDDSSITSEYTGDDWKYSFLVNNITVMMTAIKQNGNSHNSTNNNSSSHSDSSGSSTSTKSRALEQLLDGNKSWIGEWEYDGWEYNIHFVFTEDGACYFALTSETELFGAGIGTYAVKDENKLSVKIMMVGKEKTATYNFNPEDFSLTVTSKEGLVAEKGDVFCLREDPDNDVAQVQQWGELLADGAVENDLWGV